MYIIHINKGLTRSGILYGNVIADHVTVFMGLKLKHRAADINNAWTAEPLRPVLGMS